MSNIPCTGKINIVYLIDTISCDTAGTQKQLLETINRLDKELFTPYLVCLWESEWMQLNHLPCSCIELGYRGFLKFNLPHVISKLRQIIKVKKIHIVHTFFVESIFIAYFGRILSHSYPILLSSRRDMGLGKQNVPWYHNLFGCLLPIVNKSFNGIISNSEQVRQYVAKREKIDLRKIKVIRNGVDLPKIPEFEPEVFRYCHDTLWFGLVASLTPVKRHDLLLHAIAILKNKIPPKSFRLLLLGEGPELNYLKQLCNKLQLDDVVIFKGAVQNVATYVHYLDICVLCSDKEGLSNAILEYMACAKPVIATAVGGNTELISEQNGILVPPDDPNALADALLALVKDGDKRQKLGAMSLFKVKEHYSWHKAMGELQNYYRNLVETL